MVRNLPAMKEIQVQSPGWKDPLEEEMATHSSILAWRIPWTEQPGGLQSMGSQRVRHDWAANTSTFIYMCVCVCVHCSLLTLTLSPGFYFSCACMLSCFNHVWLFVTLWTVAHQAALSIGFSRQEYWSGLPFLSPGDLPNPGIKPRSPTLQADLY